MYSVKMRDIVFDTALGNGYFLIRLYFYRHERRAEKAVAMLVRGFHLVRNKHFYY